MKTKVYYNNTKLMKISTSRTYADLRRSLSANKNYLIQHDIQLSYMDDLGDYKILNNEESYREFLGCSNGLCHYIEILGLQEIKKIASDWKCYYCLTTNTMQVQLCDVCKKDKLVS